MGQEENKKLLLELHGIITGTHQTAEQIISRRTIDPEISLISDRELGGKVATGSAVSMKDYYALEDLFDSGTATAAA
ncbi:hypothetical protein ACYULU_07960 [Breznakiellaceae bacterium SP9]